MTGLENLSIEFAKDLIELVNSLKKLPKNGKSELLPKCTKLSIFILNLTGEYIIIND